MQSDGNDKQPLVVGLGVTGLSCARYLRRKGRLFGVVDSRAAPPGLEEFKKNFPDVGIELGEFRQETFNAASELIVSPGVSLKTPVIQAAMAAGIPVTGDIDIFAGQIDKPLLAVTGSNGKSTVVSLLARILERAGRKVALGGNLEAAGGKPALDLLAEKEIDIYVLELSSFQLETTRELGAEVAAILNMSEDHMDRYDSYSDYREAKMRIFRGCRKVVVNRDDPSTMPTPGLDVPVWDFGFSRPGANGIGLLENNGEQFLAYQFQKIVSVSELQVVGRHNIANVMAATALGLAAGIELPVIAEAVKSFTGLPHRCQWVARKHQVDFYNDSKATNVGAAVAAIDGLGRVISGHVILIAGGVGKGADFQPLATVLNQWGKEVILMGEAAMEIATALDKDIQTWFVSDMDEAVSLALDHAAPGDAVLLSPACASFDMFDNFQHRGEVFIRAVERLS